MRCINEQQIVRPKRNPRFISTSSPAWPATTKQHRQRKRILPQLLSNVFQMRVLIPTENIKYSQKQNEFPADPSPTIRKASNSNKSIESTDNNNNSNMIRKWSSLPLQQYALLLVIYMLDWRRCRLFTTGTVLIVCSIGWQRTLKPLGGQSKNYECNRLLWIFLVLSL